MYKYFLMALLMTGNMTGQELLTKTEAMRMALDNNYGIRIANNSVTIAANNASIYNSGFLPQIAVNAGTNYNRNNSEFEDQQKNTSEINGAVAKTYNASVNLDYTLFDGMGRMYNFKKLKEQHNLSQLEARAIIENTLLQLFDNYYEVARLTEEQRNIQTSLEISKDRLKRANYAFEFGQQTKLEVLNAEVDVNKDSIQLINMDRLVSNAKRDLNLILGREIATVFEVDIELNFNLAYEKEELLTKAIGQNVAMQQTESSIKISDFDLRWKRSNYLPTVRLSGSYGLNKADNDATFNFAETKVEGLNAGLSLRWNLFDGGNTKTQVQNARIVSDNLLIQKEKLVQELERDVSNALEIYTNALFVLEAERKNVETNERNFERTMEQYNLGQVTSLAFRQAQLNLLQARSNMNTSKYEAKNAEIYLLFLTGDLLNSDF